MLCFYLNRMIKQNVLREKTEVKILENIRVRRDRESEFIKDVTENQESKRKKGKNGFTETKRMREFSGMMGNVFSFPILFSPFNLCCRHSFIHSSL